MSRPWGHLRTLALALFGVYLVLVMRDAWIGDDAYITLRSSRQLLAGDGLVWNLRERAQAFTHPLWMFVLTAGLALTRESYYTTLLLTGSCAALGVWLLIFRLAVAPYAALLALGCLILSRAFIDYSTSGLENAATHLLLATFALLWLQSPRDQVARSRQMGRLYVVTGLLLLNRMDTGLLVGPALAWHTWLFIRQNGRLRLSLRPLARHIAVGLAPFVLWELFSLFYYGSLIPNTALAKLNTSIPRWELAEQGVYYLFESLQADPMTLSASVAGIFLAWRRRQDGLWPLALGIAAYLAYVVKIGGDFMSGRFLTAPLFLAVCVIARQRQLNAPVTAGLAGLLVLVGLSAPRATIALSPRSPAGAIDERGIADERGYYAGPSGLLNMNRRISAPNHIWRQHGERTNRGEVLVRGTIGYFGYFATRDVHVVDGLALPDPLLARLPARYDPNWRIGHFDRPIPAGYIESLRSGKNEIRDPQLHEYYDHLQRIVRGPLFSAARLKSIWLLNTGQLDDLIVFPRFRYDGELKLTLDKLATLRPLDESGGHTLPNAGALIDLGERRFFGRLLLDLPSDDRYVVAFYDGEEMLAQTKLDRGIGTIAPMRRELVLFPAEIRDRGVTHVRVLPGMGVTPYRLGKLTYEPVDVQLDGRDLERERRSVEGQAREEVASLEASERQQKAKKNEARANTPPKNEAPAPPLVEQGPLAPTSAPKIKAITSTATPANGTESQP